MATQKIKDHLRDLSKEDRYQRTGKVIKQNASKMLEAIEKEMSENTLYKKKYFDGYYTLIYSPVFDVEEDVKDEYISILFAPFANYCLYIRMLNTEKMKDIKPFYLLAISQTLIPFPYTCPGEGWLGFDTPEELMGYVNEFFSKRKHEI